MKKFLFFYPFSIALLFILFYWDISPFASIVNAWQVELSAILTSYTLPQNTMIDNHILINPNLTLVIDKACNGFIPYFFFLASIIAFPSTVKHKILWAVLGYVLLSLLNVFRIWFITQFVMNSPTNFSLAHDYLGNTFLLLSGIILFITFVKTK